MKYLPGKWQVNCTTIGEIDISTTNVLPKRDAIGASAAVKARNRSLDVLRGIAVLLVVGPHYQYPSFFSKTGWIGVELFFVLSGFLISGLLFGEYRRSGSIGLKRFWIRRGFKIYPAYYAFLFFIIVSYAAVGGLTKQIFSDLFFMQDYIQPIAEHCWSLAIEEKFYFALPLVLLIMIRISKRAENPFRTIPYLFSAIFAGSLILRAIGLTKGQLWFEVHRQAHLRMDGLFAGVNLGYYKEFRNDLFRRAADFPIWVIGAILLLPAAFLGLDYPGMATFGISATLLGFSVLVLWFYNRPFPDWMIAKWVAWIGRCSYCIYLWNLTVQNKFGYHEANRGLASLPFYLTFSIGVGWLMTYLIETPFLQLRERKFPAVSVAR